MGYNGYTEKKKITNKRYNDKFKRVLVRVTDEEKQIIEDKAREEGKSINRYILDRILK